MGVLVELDILDIRDVLVQLDILDIRDQGDVLERLVVMDGTDRLERLDDKEDLETPGPGDHLQLKDRVASRVNIILQCRLRCPINWCCRM